MKAVSKKKRLSMHCGMCDGVIFYLRQIEGGGMELAAHCVPCGAVVRNLCIIATEPETNEIVCKTSP